MNSIGPVFSFIFVAVVTIVLLVEASKYYRARRRANLIVDTTKQNLVRTAHVKVTESSDPEFGRLGNNETSGFLNLADKELVFSFLNGGVFRIPINEIEDISTRDISWIQNLMHARGPWLVIWYERNHKSQHLTFAINDPGKWLEIIQRQRKKGDTGISLV